MLQLGTVAQNLLTEGNMQELAECTANPNKRMLLFFSFLLILGDDSKWYLNSLGFWTDFEKMPNVMQVAATNNENKGYFLLALHEEFICRQAHKKH